MALVTGKCPRCNRIIQLEGSEKSSFCLFCGTSVAVDQAVALYGQALGKTKPDPVPSSAAAAAPAPVSGNDGLLAEAETALESGKFELAVKLYDEILTKDPENVKARWEMILAKTQNLKPAVIREAEEYAYAEAGELFAGGRAGVEKEWREKYWEAFDLSCRLSVETVDPRVFLELKIYQWYPNSNTFLYPISKDFNIQPILDKELWAVWNKLLEAMPENRREEFKELCDGCCRRIREYFLSGFANLEEIRGGDLSRLMGTWMLKLTTGAQKSEMLTFSQNEMGVAYMEACRTSVNGYDYYRYIKVDQNNRVMAGERRRFPSSTGLGGDFDIPEINTPVIGLMAVYEYILILPTALYARTEPQKIPNSGRALAFIEKCRAMPCFFRGENLKHTYQMRPINDNHDSGDSTRKMRNCYIATAVYGDIDAPEVRRLRRFRDESLNGSRFGRRLCSVYYKFSPKLAGRLSPGGRFSRLVRRALDAFVKRLGD